MPKVKVSQIKKVIGDVDINGMFEEMMGVRDADAEIIIPKMVNVRNILRQVYRILVQFSTFTDIRSNFAEYSEGFDEIKNFAEEMKTSTCIVDDEEKIDKYAEVSKETVNSLYRKLKEDKYLKALIVMCNKLDKYKTNFTDPNTFRENFVNQEPGLSFQIFDFSSLDLKILWAHDLMKSSVKRYILMVLSKLYEHTYNLYKIITSPDVDIDKFTGLLVNSISELKQHPELHRCKAAFSRIEKSVELLKDKFSDYYRESIASENPNALVTSFIVDVSNQGGADARLTREFRTIIQYMHKVSQKTGKNKDPNVQKIMKMLNHNYSLMERHTLGKKSDDNAEDAAEDKNDLGNLDMSLKTDENLSSAEIAEEKRLKRMEKQKAKSSKKKKNKSGRGKNNKLSKHRNEEKELEENTNEEPDDNETQEDQNEADEIKRIVECNAANDIEDNTNVYQCDKNGNPIQFVNNTDETWYSGCDMVGSGMSTEHTILEPPPRWSVFPHEKLLNKKDQAKKSGIEVESMVEVNGNSLDDYTDKNAHSMSALIDLQRDDNESVQNLKKSKTKKPKNKESAKKTEDVILEYLKGK